MAIKIKSQTELFYDRDNSPYYSMQPDHIADKNSFHDGISLVFLYLE